MATWRRANSSIYLDDFETSTLCHTLEVMALSILSPSFAVWGLMIRSTNTASIMRHCKSFQVSFPWLCCKYSILRGNSMLNERFRILDENLKMLIPERCDEVPSHIDLAIVSYPYHLSHVISFRLYITPLQSSIQLRCSHAGEHCVCI